MSEYLVSVWWNKDPNAAWKQEYFHFGTAREAQAFADKQADDLRSKGMEFDICIYERTNL